MMFEAIKKYRNSPKRIKIRMSMNHKFSIVDGKNDNCKCDCAEFDNEIENTNENENENENENKNTANTDCCKSTECNCDSKAVGSIECNHECEVLLCDIVCGIAVGKIAWCVLKKML